MPTQNRTLPTINPAAAAATTATAIRAKILAREYPRMPVSGSVWTPIAKRTFYPDFAAKIKAGRTFPRECQGRWSVWLSRDERRGLTFGAELFGKMREVILKS